MDKRSLYSFHALSAPIQRKSIPAPSGDLPTFDLLKPHHRLRRLQQWIAAHGALRLTLREAAAIVGLEPHYFSSTFHLSVGLTFGQWTRQHRAALAVRALESGQYSIEQVAELVGYQGRRSLERSVRRITGKTPAEIQRKKVIESSSSPRLEEP